MTHEEASLAGLELARYILAHPAPHITLEVRVRALSQVSESDLDRLVNWTREHLGQMQEMQP